MNKKIIFSLLLCLFLIPSCFSIIHYNKVTATSDGFPDSLHLNQDNWFNDSNGYLNWDGNSLEFNESKLADTTYYASSIDTIHGTNISGNLSSIWYYNGTDYVVQENNGINPLEVVINYTNVEHFNNLITRVYYEGSTSHIIKVQIYDYDSSSWEDYFEFTAQAGFNTYTIPVFDPEEHLDEGNVSMRFEHQGNGISSHIFNIDFVWLVDGSTVGGSTDLVGYAKYNFAFNNFNGTGDFSTSGNITADTFKTSLNTSFGMCNNGTDFFIGYIEGVC